MRWYIHPYRVGSKGARALADALDGYVLRLSGSRFRMRPTRRVINWGSCNCPEAYQALNPSRLTRVIRDKLETFRTFSRPVEGMLLPRIPGWTESRQEAFKRLQRPVSEGGWAGCMARLSLTGQSGSGIIYVKEGEAPEAPLYVEYVPKDAEYRVHVFKGLGVVDVQKKVKDPDREVTDWKVRSHHNGFIFTRHDAAGRFHRDVAPADVFDQAKLALAISGLDFGAVDVVFNEKRGKAYVLEINSAPGLKGRTVEIYRDAFRSL